MLITVTLLLGFLVFIHEGGHYLAARACGVRVSEFMIGLPGPSIGFTRGETRFGITAFRWAAMRAFVAWLLLATALT